MEILYEPIYIQKYTKCGPVLANHFPLNKDRALPLLNDLIELSLDKIFYILAIPKKTSTKIRVPMLVFDCFKDKSLTKFVKITNIKVWHRWISKLFSSM